jgi:hypothetical protein
MVKRVFKLTNKSSRFQSLSFLPDGRNSLTLNKKEQLKEKSKVNLVKLFTIFKNI